MLVTAFEALPAELAFDEATAIDIVNAAEAQALAAVPNDAAKQQGVLIGESAAAMMLAVRTGDGSDVGPFLGAWKETDQPGRYRFVGPDNPDDDFAFAPRWGEVTPFVFDDITKIRPRPPYPLNSRRYAADFNELKTMGSAETGGARHRRRPRPPCSGWRTHHRVGTASHGASPAGSTCGRRLVCSGC